MSRARDTAMTPKVAYMMTQQHLPTPPTPSRAGIYTRISLDRAGEALGVARQEQDCRAKAKALGWTVVHVYTDNDVSASSGVARPAYDRLMADLEAGTVNAVVVYDLDRLTRKPVELETFIDLADRLKVQLANCSGDTDLATSGGRLMARIKGAVARQEAERIAERVKRQKQQRAEDGKPFGSRYRAFGYSRAFEVVEDEATLLRDAFSRVALGESVQSITNEWNTNGILTTAGGRWRRGAVANVLNRPGYAGISTYDGQRVGVTSYPSIIDEATYEAAQQSMTGKSNVGRNARTYLLSGIVTCGKCHLPMYGNSSSAGRYLCKPDIGGCGKVTMKMSWIDDAIRHEVMRHSQDTPVVLDSRNYQSEISTIDKRREALLQANTDGTLALQDLLLLLKADQDKRRALIKDAATAQAKDNILWKALGHHDQWESASVSARRVWIQRYIQAVIVKPTTKLGRVQYDPKRLSILWTDGTTSRPIPPNPHHGMPKTAKLIIDVRLKGTADEIRQALGEPFDGVPPV
jgi:site-specific DNA recombinase